MILVIDNYDSFTYNLVQYIGEFDSKIKVIRNDAISIEQLKSLRISKIIISPGPGRPENAGITLDVIKTFYDRIPILGVCLGHQAIGQAFGANITYAKEIMHGKVSSVYHDQTGLYAGIESPFKATRYHSLIIDKKGFPKKELDVTSKLKDGTIMGVQHRNYPVYGIQFHPESILTTSGKRIIFNFLSLKNRQN
ncbi:MAG: aminodeoxychorismate/anthranilate synthase component II [Candidatus Margulisiibacteriota bacterium]